MNVPAAKMNAREKRRRNFCANDSPPGRSKPDAEDERRRRRIGIWPVVDGAFVIIGPVMRAIMAVMAMVTSVVAVRAEIGRIGRAGILRLRLRRCSGRSDRCRTGKHERSRNKSCRNQALHDGPLLHMIKLRAAISLVSRQRPRRNRPAAKRACSCTVAFSSEVDTGSREENASKRNLELRSDLIRIEDAPGCRTHQRCQ